MAVLSVADKPPKNGMVVEAPKLLAGVRSIM
jgi:hypothetical protein